MIAVWDIEPEARAAERGKARAASAHYRDVQIAREIAREIHLRDGLGISADDIRREMSRRFPDTVYGNWMGAVFRTSEWRPVGSVKSKSPGSHANRLVLWALRNGGEE